MYGETGSTYNIFVMKLEVKSSVGLSMVGLKNNIEKNFKNLGCGDV
jgi:hypothetical protein